MLLFGTLFALAGAVAGLLGGVLGCRLFNRLSPKPMTNEHVASYHPWQRSLIIGLLTSVATVFAFSLGDMDVNRWLLGLSCLCVSFTFVAVYTLGSVAVFIKCGPAILDAGELSLAMTVILTGLLCACGLLWITLVFLGGISLLAATVLNGMWIYRLR